MDSNALIEAVKSHPSLYSKKHASSNNTDQKNAIWSQIADDLNQPVEKCKAKWRNLRDSYQKSVKWRRELEMLGKLSTYHEYKHEGAMSFLEVGLKRKSSYERETRSSKTPKIEMAQDAVYIENHDQAVEYLIESEANETERPTIEYEDEEISIHSNFNEENEDFHTQDLKLETAESDEQEFLNYETTMIAHTVVSSQPDDVPYQESFINEPQTSHTIEIDSWLSSIKETLLSFPKLTRARTKKQINDLISEVEIKYLESIETDRK